KLFSDDLLDALFDAFHADLQLGKIPRIIAKRRGKQRLAVTKITPRTFSVALKGAGIPVCGVSG
ncbi:MAG TPA: hypothetical protein VIR28_01380, partial [Achromobacter sp.]|uniref:hypothetical protein n=1 Tax=Achromobacter sp. TaxID=134375 RepID=UPI002F959C86